MFSGREMTTFVSSGGAFEPRRNATRQVTSSCCAYVKMTVDHDGDDALHADAVTSRRAAVARMVGAGTALSYLLCSPPPATALSKRRLKFKSDWMPAVEAPDSGVRFREISIGSGVEPRNGDTVAVHFSLFYNDLEVESSRESQGLAASPYGFTFGRSSGPGSTVPGINLGMAGMKVGGLRLIEIPPELAFGKRGRKPMIPPDATVEYAVQLLSCKRSGTNSNVSGVGSSMF